MSNEHIDCIVLLKTAKLWRGDIEGEEFSNAFRKHFNAVRVGRGVATGPDTWGVMFEVLEAPDESIGALCSRVEAWSRAELGIGNGPLEVEHVPYDDEAQDAL